jgi:hypothetical protein
VIIASPIYFSGRFDADFIADADVRPPHISFSTAAHAALLRTPPPAASLMPPAAHASDVSLDAALV